MVIYHSQWVRLYEVPGYIYELYLTTTDQCEIVDVFYDLAEYCDSADCSLHKIFDNNFSSVFKIIGILNALAAVAYERTMIKSDIEFSKNIHYDLWYVVGLNIGRLIRYSVKYEYDEIWD